MAVKKLESSSNQAIIAEEVAILKTILETITRDMVGDETFLKIEQIVKLSEQDDYIQLEKMIESLTDDEMVIMSRYFSILPLLINISEDVDLAYEINFQNNKGINYLGKLSHTIEEVASKENAKDILENVTVVPVLTAHPTQVQRKTVLELTNKIHGLLRQYRDVKSGVINEEKWLEELRRYVEIIMQTDIIREKKLKVKNEITNVMAYYHSSIIPAVTRLTLAYKELAKEKGLELENPKPITMGMWIGGDRDGNPFVTAETLQLSASIQSQVIIEYYLEKLSKLYRSLSLSSRFSKTSKALDDLAALSSDTSIYREHEPYRKAFHYIQSKMSNTLTSIKENASHDKQPSDIYETAEDFKKDLLIIKDSLVQNGEGTLISGDFSDLLQAVDVFGFFLASIDMRQDSSVQEACVAELLKSANIVDDYSALNETEKCQILIKELE